ncbi:MAG: hypothetical protein ACKO96_05090 [Flammeovirgaceae bacterium]
MVDYIGSIIGTNTLGQTGQCTVVRGRISFTAATLAANPTDTYVIPNLFTHNTIPVPVEILGFKLVSTTTTPASLVATVGNSDSANGYLTSKALTETGQLSRFGDGALIGTRVTNPSVTMTVTTAAGAAYTGDLIYEFLVRATND